MSNYRLTVVEIGRQIKEDKISLEAQLRYFRYLLENVSRETGEIDRKIEVLKRQREKLVKDFMNAPQRIEELQGYLHSLDAKKRKMLVQPKIEKLLELKGRLAKLGVTVE